MKDFDFNDLDSWLTLHNMPSEIRQSGGTIHHVFALCKPSYGVYPRNTRYPIFSFPEDIPHSEKLNAWQIIDDRVGNEAAKEYHYHGMFSEVTESNPGRSSTVRTFIKFDKEVETAWNIKQMSSKFGI
jgi:hypothetical protein